MDLGTVRESLTDEELDNLNRSWSDDVVIGSNPVSIGMFVEGLWGARWFTMRGRRPPVGAVIQLGELECTKVVGSRRVFPWLRTYRVDVDHDIRYMHREGTQVFVVNEPYTHTFNMEAR